MPAYYKVLGQAQPSPNTFTDLYSVPGGANAVISTVNVCNLSTSNVTFRLMVRPAGPSGIANTVASQQYLAFNVPVATYDATAISIGMSLGAGDIITGHSTEGNVAFTVFGTEIRF